MIAFYQKTRSTISLFSFLIELAAFILHAANAAKVRTGLRKNNGFITAFRKFAPHLTADWIEYFCNSHLLYTIRDF